MLCSGTAPLLRGRILVVAGGTTYLRSQFLVQSEPFCRGSVCSVHVYGRGGDQHNGGCCGSVSAQSGEFVLHSEFYHCTAVLCVADFQVELDSILVRMGIHPTTGALTSCTRTSVAVKARASCADSRQ